MTYLIDGSWLPYAKKGQDPEWNLICFPFAGGTAEYFLPWVNKLNSCGFYPIQLPGRASRYSEAPLNHIDAFLDSIVPILLPVIKQRPYVIFGHSMGGYLSYEFAKKIKRLAGIEPNLIVISASPAPDGWSVRHKLSDLSKEDFYDYFINLGGFHPEVLAHESFMTLQMDILLKDCMLYESCVYDEPAQFTCPVIALSGTEDSCVSFESMQRWGNETTGDFLHKKMQGDHFYLNRKTDQVLSLIRQALD